MMSSYHICKPEPELCRQKKNARSLTEKAVHSAHYGRKRDRYRNWWQTEEKARCDKLWFWQIYSSIFCAIVCEWFFFVWYQCIVVMFYRINQMKSVRTTENKQDKLTWALWVSGVLMKYCPLNKSNHSNNKSGKLSSIPWNR